MNKIIPFILVFLAACAPADSAPDVDCSTLFSNMQRESLAMADHGRLQKARESVAAYAPCYNGNADYWSLRALLASKTTSGEPPNHAQAREAADYMGRALAIAPDNAYYRVGAGAYWLSADEYAKGREAFEKGVLAGIDPVVTGDARMRLRRAIFDVAPHYVNAAVEHNDITRARKHLTPYLAEACSTFPQSYRDHYAQTIVWIAQQFEGGDQTPPGTDPGSVKNALAQACATLNP